MITFRQHQTPIVGKNAELLKYRALEHHSFIQQLRVHGVGGQKVRRMHRSGEIAMR